jgi:hypothetical protein
MIVAYYNAEMSTPFEAKFLVPRRQFMLSKWGETDVFDKICQVSIHTKCRNSRAYHSDSKQPVKYTLTWLIVAMNASTISLVIQIKFVTEIPACKVLVTRMR